LIKGVAFVDAGSFLWDIVEDAVEDETLASEAIGVFVFADVAAEVATFGVVLGAILSFFLRGKKTLP